MSEDHNIERGSGRPKDRTLSSAVMGFDILRALNQLHGDKVKSDNQFNKPTPKDDHEQAYTKILDAYADNIHRTLKTKRLFKAMVFWLAFALLALVFILLVFLLVWSIWKKPFTGVKEWCTVIIPALVSFLTVFFVIPKIITKYLFNSEEEKYMSEIIKNIQSYDKEDHSKAEEE